MRSPGAGYINGKLDRPAAARQIARDDTRKSRATFIRLVEHTSINPNKAAHIGHLRNAILGDTFVRLLRAAGQRVDVQNYIDNTGVQVADVVVGLTHLEGYDLAGVRQLLADLKAKGSALTTTAGTFMRGFRSGTTPRKPRLRSGRKFVSIPCMPSRPAAMKSRRLPTWCRPRCLRRHLETMLRLGIEYDFLPRESEILHLKFWDLAFAQLKAKGVLYLETEGKNKGCWVMRRASTGTDAGRAG